MRGRLIIIEAGDGCGKATQAAALAERLRREGRDARQVEFPDYESDSSALIKMYLAGRFGGQADAVNAYAASLFYAVDRYASYQTKWKAWYAQGAVIIADRYTTSNMAHQAAKLESAAEREAYLAWLWDLEFIKMGLPTPDAVVFLEMPPETSARLIAARAAAQGAGDIHERDAAYLARCHAAYCALAARYGWHTVHCAPNGDLQSVAEIHAAVYAAVQPHLPSGGGS